MEVSQFPDRGVASLRIDLKRAAYKIAQTCFRTGRFLMGKMCRNPPRKKKTKSPWQKFYQKHLQAVKLAKGLILVPTI